MGAEYSTLIQKELELSTPNQLLENQQFLNFVEFASKDLSYEALTNIRKIFGSPAASNDGAQLQNDFQVRNSRQLQPLIQVAPSNVEALEETVISLNLIQPHCWMNLFLDQQQEVDPLGFHQQLLCSSNSILSTTPTDQQARWKRRFLLAFFYQLHRLYNGDGNFNRRACEVLKGALRPYADSEMTLEMIEGKLGKWVRRGQRYRNLCESLQSSAVLFCLPDSVPDSFWEQNLPLTGTVRMVTIDLLHQKGTVALAGNENLQMAAQAIEDGLIEPFMPVEAGSLSLGVSHNARRHSATTNDGNQFSETSISPQYAAGNEEQVANNFLNKTLCRSVKSGGLSPGQYIFGKGSSPSDTNFG